MKLSAVDNLSSQIHRQLGVAGGEKDKTISSLSTGLRINKAADDASNISIASRVKVAASSISAELENLSALKGALVAVETQLSETADALTRLEELTIQGQGLAGSSVPIAISEAIEQNIKLIERAIERPVYNNSSTAELIQKLSINGVDGEAAPLSIDSLELGKVSVLTIEGGGIIKPKLGEVTSIPVQNTSGTNREVLVHGSDDKLYLISRDTTSGAYFFERIDPSGQEAGVRVQLPPGTTDRWELEELGDGTFVIIEGRSGEVYRVDRDGNTLDSYRVDSGALAGQELRHNVIDLGDGQYFVSWYNRASASVPPTGGQGRIVSYDGSVQGNLMETAPIETRKVPFESTVHEGKVYSLYTSGQASQSGFIGIRVLDLETGSTVLENQELIQINALISDIGEHNLVVNEDGVFVSWLEGTGINSGPAFIRAFNHDLSARGEIKEISPLVDRLSDMKELITQSGGRYLATVTSNSSPGQDALVQLFDKNLEVVSSATVPGAVGTVYLSETISSSNRISLLGNEGRQEPYSLFQVDVSEVVTPAPGQSYTQIDIEFDPIAEPGKSLFSIDSARKVISDLRTKVGAQLNGIDHRVDELGNRFIQTSAQLSRIQDTRYGEAAQNLSRALLVSEVNVMIENQINEQRNLVLQLI